MYAIDRGVTECRPMRFATLERVAGPDFRDLFRGGKSSGCGPLVSNETSAADVGHVNKNLNAYQNINLVCGKGKDILLTFTRSRLQNRPISGS